MQRNSIRLRDFDYTTQGAYFVTICSHQRECIFGEILEQTMHPNLFGNIILEEWQRTAQLRQNVLLDEFILMPNHLHAIIHLTNEPPPSTPTVGARRASPNITNPHKSVQKELAISKGQLHSTRSGVVSGSLGAVIGGFKSAVTKRINQSRGTQGFPVWQRDFWEHIIRNDAELERIQTYITNNPTQWLFDEEFA